jgi:hypothetical protein
VTFVKTVWKILFGIAAVMVKMISIEEIRFDSAYSKDSWGFVAKEQSWGWDDEWVENH